MKLHNICDNILKVNLPIKPTSANIYSRAKRNAAQHRNKSYTAMDFQSGGTFKDIPRMTGGTLMTTLNENDASPFGETCDINDSNFMVSNYLGNGHNNRTMNN